MRAAPAIALVVLALAGSASAQTPDATRVNLKYQLDQISEVYLERNGLGQPVYVLVQSDGHTERLSPAQFANRLLVDHDTRPWWKRVLNITNPLGIAWVTIGLLGQLLFTGRMLVQWLASEKEKRSVVPPVFWWMSLIGATMLLVYFGWRKDIVGILGQATGWFIYVRNLYFIKRTANITDDPAPEPELGD